MTFSEDLKELRKKWWEYIPIEKCSFVFDKAIKSGGTLSSAEGILSIQRFLKSVPDEYKNKFKNEMHLFYRNKFYKLKLSEKEFSFIEEAKPENKIIFDFEIASKEGYILSMELNMAIDRIDASWENYSKICKYSDDKYKIYKEVKVPESDVYDLDYSLTKEQSKKQEKWIQKHLKKFHHDKKYQGAIGISQFQTVMGFTSIGRFVYCICEDCKKQGKMMEDYSFTVQEIDE